MDVRLKIVGAFAAATLITACGPDRITEEDAGTDAGCIGVCSTDGGQDGGNIDENCQGVSSDGGTVSLTQLRDLPACGQFVKVPDVVVHTVTFKRDSGVDIQGEFYVGQLDGGGPGVFVDKFYSDTPKNYEPTVGHRLTLNGYLYENYRFNSGLQHTTNRNGYRREVGSQFGADGGQGKLAIQFLSHSNPTPEEIEVDETFSAEGGTVAAHPELLGRRVHYPGPVYIQEPRPLYMREWNADLAADAGEQLFVNTNRNYWQGFELTGGVVVHDYNVRFDCEDYRNLAEDADGGALLFPNGVSGVWETYTMVLFIETCPDGSTDFTKCMVPGYIPAEDGGFLTTHINVITPFECSDVEGGVIDAGTE